MDISQASNITILDASTETTQVVFIGLLEKYTIRGRYQEIETIYNELKIKSNGSYKKGKVTITSIDYENKEKLETLFGNLTNVTIIDEDGSTFYNVNMLGKSLEPTKKYIDDGDPFWTTDFEVR